MLVCQKPAGRKMTGTSVSEDLLDANFRDFCIGK